MPEQNHNQKRKKCRSTRCNTKPPWTCRGEGTGHPEKHQLYQRESECDVAPPWEVNETVEKIRTHHLRSRARARAACFRAQAHVGCCALRRITNSGGRFHASRFPRTPIQKPKSTPIPWSNRYAGEQSAGGAARLQARSAAYVAAQTGRVARCIVVRGSNPTVVHPTSSPRSLAIRLHHNPYSLTHRDYL